MDLVGRALYTAAVGGDQLTKTVLATAMTGVMFPGGLVVNGPKEARRLEFYAALASSHDPDKIFQPPPSPIPISARSGRGLEDTAGRVELLRFHSPFEPLHPDLRSHFRPRDNNATARAQHWRHDDGPRPTLITIHGFGASGAKLNARVFELRGFFEEGWDVLLYTLPFHGSRQSSRSPFNGAELFSGGFAALAESFLQAICELRVLLDHLGRQGVPRIGATGLSLGGYTTALLAAVDDRLDFAIPNSAVTSMPRLIEHWFPANLGTSLLERIKHIPRELITRSSAIHSPLNYPSKLPRERLLIIGGRGDRVAPPEQSLALWEHWQRPALHWFRGSHILHLQREGYLTAMRQTMGPAQRLGGADVPLPAPVPLRPRLRST